MVIYWGNYFLHTNVTFDFKINVLQGYQYQIALFKMIYIALFIDKAKIKNETIEVPKMRPILLSKYSC